MMCYGSNMHAAHLEVRDGVHFLAPAAAEGDASHASLGCWLVWLALVGCDHHTFKAHATTRKREYSEVPSGI